MVVIRLSRGGSKKRPFYHVVTTDKRSRRDGRYVEKLGYFNPIARGEESRFHINQARFDYWVSVGAQPSNRVNVLMKELANGTSGKPIEKPKKEEQAVKPTVTEPEASQTTETVVATPEAEEEMTVASAAPAEQQTTDNSESKSEQDE